MIALYVSKQISYDTEEVYFSVRIMIVSYENSMAYTFQLGLQLIT